MNSITAVLIWLGIAASPSEITTTMVEDNRAAIQFYMSDPSFMNYYESITGRNEEIESSITVDNTTIVITNVLEGD